MGGTDAISTNKATSILIVLHRNLTDDEVDRVIEWWCGHDRKKGRADQVSKIEFETESRDGVVSVNNTDAPIGATIYAKAFKDGKYRVTIERVRAPLPDDVTWDNDKILDRRGDFDRCYYVRANPRGERGVTCIECVARANVPGWAIDAFRAEGLL